MEESWIAVGLGTALGLETFSKFLPPEHKVPLGGCQDRQTHTVKVAEGQKQNFELQLELHWKLVKLTQNWVDRFPAGAFCVAAFWINWNFLVSLKGSPVSITLQ